MSASKEKSYHKISSSQPSPYDAWEWSIDQPLLNNGQSRLLGIYTKHMNLKTFECHPCRGFISDLSGWRENNVSRVKSDLEVLGYIRTIGRGKYQKVWVNYGFKPHHMRKADIVSLMDRLSKKETQNDTESSQETSEQYQNEPENSIKNDTRNCQVNCSSNNPSRKDHQQPSQSESSIASASHALDDSELPTAPAQPGEGDAAEPYRIATAAERHAILARDGWITTPPSTTEPEAPHG